MLCVMRRLAYLSTFALCLGAGVRAQGVPDVQSATQTVKPANTAPETTVVSKPPEAQVTFYSHGMTILGGLPGHTHGAFKGRVYEGTHQLAFMEPAHFVTFSFAPGPHEFGATWWVTKDAQKGPHVLINLADNQHYFIETYVKNINIFGGVDLLIKEVTCDYAKRDNADSKPLEQPHLRPDGRTAFVPETAFPGCS